MIFDAERNCYRYWWACLPAIPVSREAQDWWTPPGDGRSTPYRRLKRVWNDATWFKRPKDDRLRKHEFSNPDTGTHMMIQLWENWMLFHPNDWVPHFLAEIGIGAGEEPWDACWSYEYGDYPSGKLADLTLHLRDGKGRGSLFVIEAKWNTDQLKKMTGTGPDANPCAYLDLDCYKAESNRSLVYLVHEKKRRQTQAEVESQSIGCRYQWGVWSWESLVSLQCKLAKELLPQPLGLLIRDSMLRQAFPSCIDWNAFKYPKGIQRADVPGPRSLSERFTSALEGDDCPARLRPYLMGARCYWDCRTAADSLPRLPFPYLSAEPSFPELHDQIGQSKKTKQGTPQASEINAALWQLGGPTHPFHANVAE